LTVTGLSWPPEAFRCVPGSRALSVSISRRAKIAPNSATPIEPPICWKNAR